MEKRERSKDEDEGEEGEGGSPPLTPTQLFNNPLILTLLINHFIFIEVTSFVNNTPNIIHIVSINLQVVTPQVACSSSQINNITVSTHNTVAIIRITLTLNIVFEF